MVNSRQKKERYVMDGEAKYGMMHRWVSTEEKILKHGTLQMAANYIDGTLHPRLSQVRGAQRL